MRKIFLAFPGYKLSIKQRIKTIGDFEFWDLQKINEKEFIKLIQQKIKPINKNVRKNYFTTSKEAIYCEAYKESNWGMLLPDYTNDNLGGRYESLLTINLFSDPALPLTFYVSSMGIMVEQQKLSFFEKSKCHAIDRKFTNKKFTQFYNLLFPEIMGTNWVADEVPRWSQEDWRLHIACLSFTGLFKYQRSKEVMTWQRECADIVALYETLLSRKKNDGGHYRIIQRIEVLIGHYYKAKFSQIKQESKDLYNYRNEFVHGSFFNRLKRATKTYPNDSSMAQLPNVDFRFLESQAKTVREIFISFLYLRKKFRNTKAKKLKNLSIPQIINLGIMDVRLRKRIQRYTNEILRLLP